MNTVAVVISLALLVTVASGLGYNSYNRYPSFGGGNSWGSGGGRFLGNSGFNLGHRGGYGRKYYFHLFYIKNFCFDQYHGQQLLSLWTECVPIVDNNAPLHNITLRL